MGDNKIAKFSGQGELSVGLTFPRSTSLLLTCLLFVCLHLGGGKKKNWNGCAHANVRGKVVKYRG